MLIVQTKTLSGVVERETTYCALHIIYVLVVSLSCPPHQHVFHKTSKSSLLLLYCKNM